MMAEDDRAKIIERHRRGKRHAARSGAVNVLRGAPYGYRYVKKHEGGGQARDEVVPDEARVVRQVFAWVGRDRRSIGEVCRRLMQAGERTRTGRTVWERSVVWALLKNPASRGRAAFGKTRQGPRARSCGPNGAAREPRRAASDSEVPAGLDPAPGARPCRARDVCRGQEQDRKTAAMPASRAVGHALSSRASSNVNTVALPSPANP